MDLVRQFDKNELPEPVDLQAVRKQALRGRTPAVGGAASAPEVASSSSSSAGEARGVNPNFFFNDYSGANIVGMPFYTRYTPVNHAKGLWNDNHEGYHFGEDL